MSNKLPKSDGRASTTDMQAAALQHQLHLQTVDILTKLYSATTADADQSHPLRLSVKDALENLLEPFKPTQHSLPSPAVQDGTI